MKQIFAVLALLLLPMVARAELPDFTEIVRQSSPAVVKILVNYEVEAAQSGPDMEQLPEYLKRFFEGRGQQGQPRERSGIGSGFVISSDGYIVTNNHVVDNANSVTVRLTDRREFEATVIGTDPRSDLALLKIEADALATLSLGRQDDIEVGQWVLAIGSPFGLDFSVTAGIVSAMGRSLPTERGENYVPFIQTDVAINPGNSGGPLFNLAGEVIGVNSQIFTRSGGSIGLSFAIPVNVVRNVVEQLKTNGEVVRGWLGVSIQDVDRNLAESFGLERPMGALVAQVGTGSPAAEAGIESGDIIIRFDNSDIETSADLPHIVGLLAPGSKVDTTIVREGQTRVIEVEVGGLDADDEPRVSQIAGESGDLDFLGMSVETADPQTMAELGLTGGVVVTRVKPDSPSAEAGVAAGDIMTRLGSVAIGDLSDLKAAIESLVPGKSVPARLIRRGSPLFIGIRVPPAE
jgi:serine protease Do